MESNKNLRAVVLNMLTSTLEKGEFSHVVINNTFADKSLTQRDRAFINRLYSGTLEKLVYIDFIISSFSSVKISKMKPVIRNVLRLSIYQMKYMESVPVHSCIDEAVKLTRKRGFANLTGFVNAVLRKVQREADNLELPDYVSASVPEWVYKLINRQYGRDDAEKYFGSDEIGNETVIRLNLMKDSAENIISILEEEGCSVRRLSESDGAAAISGFESLTDLKAFRQGLFIMQDKSSMTAVNVAAKGVKENKLTIDVCAAPGGKSLFMAEKFPEAVIVSRDLTEYKVNLIRDNIKRLGIKNIRPEVHDALVKDEKMYEQADVVIADLPCSGLGVIRKKPDILYRLKECDLEDLQRLQRDILSAVQSYVRPGGILLFSTCTVNKGENEENTSWFLDNYEFSLEKELSFLPGRDDSDGFYIARFRKKQI